MALTATIARELWDYQEDTGHFIWKVEIRAGKNLAFVKAWPGKRAGNLSPSVGYRFLSYKGHRYAEHRVAMLMMTGVWPESDVDHINGVRTDNRWVNLRQVTRAQNMQNLRRAHADNATGFLGVTKKRNRFEASISVRGTRKRLGVFSTPELAHQAYVSAKRQLHEMGAL